MKPAEMPPGERLLWAQRQLRLLRDLGVRKALTLWPEWAAMIALLDKLVENRGRLLRPPIGERIAIHAGASVGGRKGKVARIEGIQSIMDMAQVAGWTVDASLEREGHPPIRWSELSEVGISEIDARAMTRCFEGRPPPAVRAFLDFAKGERAVRLDPNDITVSAIVAHARVVGVIHPDRLPADLTPIVAAHPWYVVGEVGWILEDVVRLDDPIPIERGALGLWPLPEIAA